MALASPATVEGYQERLRFRKSDRIEDAIGVLGQFVPATGRPQQAREDFCLRRLLVGLARSGRLPMPMTVLGAGTSAVGPDFIWRLEGARSHGVEVTSAGSRDWHAWNSWSAATGNDVDLYPSEDGYVDDQPLRMVVDDIIAAIDRKSGKFERYRAIVPTCDLLIYETSEGGIFIDREHDAVRRLLRHRLAGRESGFSAIHLILGEELTIDLLGSMPEVVDLSEDYLIDFSAWCRAQARALRENRTNALDFHNLAEEIESMGRRDRRAVASHLRNLLVHLLKYQIQPERRTRSWLSSIINAREEIKDLIQESPSMAREIPEMIQEEFERAKRLATVQTGRSATDFPAQCPYTIPQLLDDDYLPEDRA